MARSTPFRLPAAALALTCAGALAGCPVNPGPLPPPSLPDPGKEAPGEPISVPAPASGLDPGERAP